MSTSPAPDEPSFFDLLELDIPHRPPGDRSLPVAHADGTHTVQAPLRPTATLDEVHRQAAHTVASAAIVPNADLTTVLGSIAHEGAANAGVAAIGSIASGELQSVGFTTKEGYIAAIRHGVKRATYDHYITLLRTRFGLTRADLDALALPMPLVESDLPVGAGIVHVPTGPSVFDRPKAERVFVVGAPPVAETVAITPLQTRELIAGAVAEGHCAIVAWEGSTGTTRGALATALAAIDRAAWAPRAPNARAQAGTAIGVLAKGGFDVTALRKTHTDGHGLAVGEHVWTVGAVGHANTVGDTYGRVVVRFKLTGDVLTYEGDAAIAAPVLADFAQRLGQEILKSSDVTAWLGRTLRDRLDAVRFGALGWLVPAVHVAAARALVYATREVGFGTGWVDGLPVATSDQLRDGIVRGLRAEVEALIDTIEHARVEARQARESAQKEGWESGGSNRKLPSGDIGERAAASFLRDLKAIGERVVAYGQLLGPARVASLRDQIRAVMVDLEGVLGADYSGIQARFGLIWEEIERDRAAHGGAL